MTARDPIARLVQPYRIAKGGKFRLKNFAPADTGGLEESKHGAKELLAASGARLTELQEKLYAENRWSLLLIFQAMDAAGKDSTIKHVMSGINPQGCDVSAFKAPSHQELAHDFLWRAAGRLPARGKIGIFNRSYYEEVLIVRVHQGLLAPQRIPPRLVTHKIWRQRFEDINAFERHLARNGTLVLKFFLNVSKAEQKRRFLERLDRPEKNWKFSLADVREREHWKAYMQAYEDMIVHTAREDAPWFVVPADNKWFTRLVVSAAIVDALDGLALDFPGTDARRRRELAAARRALAGRHG